MQQLHLRELSLEAAVRQARLALNRVLLIPSLLRLRRIISGLLRPQSSRCRLVAVY